MAAATSLYEDDDLKTLSSLDVSELRAYFRDSAANVGGLRGRDFEAEIMAKQSKGGKSDQERITDRQIEHAGRARRVERVRDRMPGGAWSILAMAFGEPRHNFPAGVPEDIGSLLGDTETALDWGYGLVREAETEEAAKRAYATARADGVTPNGLIELVWWAMDSVARTHIDATRARDAAIDRMMLVAGTLPSKRKKREAEHFEAALREAEGTLARAGHEWVCARQALGRRHIEDQRDDETRREHAAIRDVNSRIRLLSARPVGE